MLASESKRYVAINVVYPPARMVKLTMSEDENDASGLEGDVSQELH